MKSRSEIESRLRKLRVKYAKRHIKQSQARCPQNCVYNYEHESSSSNSSLSLADAALVPRKQVTLLVVQPHSPVRLCMYGAEDPAKWSGLICDKDETARSCKVFTPKTTLTKAREEFLENLADDEFVFDNYRDMAAFQWVLSDRLHKMPLSWWESLILWFQILFFRREKPILEAPIPELTENFWNDDESNPPTTGS